MGSYKKKLFIVLSLFSLISCFACSSVNAASAITDSYTYNIDLINLSRYTQEYRSSIFFHYLGKSNITSSQKETLKTYFSDYFVYFRVYPSNSGNNVYNQIACFYPKNTNFNQLSLTQASYLQTEDDYIYDPYIDYNTSGYNVNCIRVYVDTYGGYYTTGNADTFIPTFCIGYEPSNISNFLNDLPTSSGGLWSMLFNKLDNNTDAVEDTTQAVNNLRNDFNEEESDSDYDFPTSNPTTDPTSSGIDNIFNMFYMRINSWNALGINVPIPFTGKSFTINPDITENIINGWTPTTQIATVFKTLLSGVWYYLLGRYIVKDVQHYVDGLQTGDILTKSDTNIKTEML